MLNDFAVGIMPKPNTLLHRVISVTVLLGIAKAVVLVSVQF